MAAKITQGRPRRRAQPAATRVAPARCIAVRPTEGRALVRGVNIVKRHQKQTAQPGRRHHLQGGADPPVQPRARRPARTASRPASASSTSARAGPQEGPRRQAFGSRDRWLTPKEKAPKAPTRRRRPSRRAQGSAKQPKGSRPRGADKGGGKAAKADAGAKAKAQGVGAAGDAAPAHPVRRDRAQAADRAVRLQEPDAGADDREDRHQHGHRRGRQRPQEGRRRRPPTSR